MPLVTAPRFEAMVQRYPEAANLPPDPLVIATFLREQVRPTRRQIVPHIGQRDNGEPLVALPPVTRVGRTGALLAAQNNAKIYPFTDDKLLVRESFADQLRLAAGFLQDNAPGMQLRITYGYRPLSVQKDSNERRKQEILASGFQGSEDDLLDRMHLTSAQVEVSGHPTGGAGDGTLVDWHGDQINMGTPEQLVDFEQLSEAARAEIKERVSEVMGIEVPDPEGVLEDASELFWWPFISKRQGEARDLLRGSFEAADLYFYEGETGHADSRKTPEGAWHATNERRRLSADASVGSLIIAEFVQVPDDVARAYASAA